MLPLNKAKHLFDCAFDYELIATTYHEAGHIVSAVYNFIRVKNSSIPMETPMGGIIDTDIFRPTAKVPQAVNNALITSHLSCLRGGPISEYLYYKDLCGAARLPRQLSIGAQHDNKSFNQIIKKYDVAATSQERKKIRELIDGRVEKLLRSHWIDVRNLAHALYRRRELSAKQIEAALLNGPHAEFWLARLQDITEIYSGKNHG